MSRTRFVQPPFISLLLQNSKLVFFPLQAARERRAARVAEKRQAIIAVEHDAAVQE